MELNVLPFMKGRKQLPAGEVQEGRKLVYHYKIMFTGLLEG